MDNTLLQRDQRMSRAQKEANDKQWYKNKIDLLDRGSTRNIFGYGGVSEYHRMKVNYDLYNNVIDLSDFQHVCKPFGAGQEGFELPAKMTNKDIISPKIKLIQGMEMSRPFGYKVVAMNQEATTRKEQAEFGKMKDYVISTIMAPIREQLELQQEAEFKDRQLTPDEVKMVQQKLEEQLETMTPDEVKVYMKRDHQDPAEVMSHQLLEYLTIKDLLKDKFNLGVKHAAISAKEFYWVGEVNGEPTVRTCNPLRANYPLSPDKDFVEDGEWFTYEYPMTPSEAVAFFTDELSNEEIDRIYKDFTNYTQNFERDLFDWDRQGPISRNDYNSNNTVRVLHAVWKSLREIKFLTYEDMETGEVNTMIVDETYQLDPAIGDIEITSEWIPEVYEGWKIGSNIYKKMRPVPGQFKDMDNLYECKLPYYGAVYDATNSQPTSIVDRGKVWQYYLNIVYYRAELLIASDKGKKVMMNINAIPDSAGIDIEKFQYFFESSPFGWYNPNEEGTGYNDVNTIAKVIDLSTASDIGKYIELVGNIKQECGEAMGISRPMEAQMAERDAVANTQQALVQNSYILEPFFNMHGRIKKNVLQALLECAKVTYSKKKPQKLSYVLDDMSLQTLDFDPALLENSTLGIFINDSSTDQEIKTALTNLAQAAIQNQQIKLSDVFTILKETSLTVAEDKLRASEDEMQQREAQQQQAQAEAQQQLQDSAFQHEKERWDHEKEMVILKESERRETEIAKAALTGMSFNPDVDSDGDGENDFFEIAKHGLDADIKRGQLSLENAKFSHQKMVDKEKLANEKEKIKVQKMGKNKPSK